MSAVLGVTAILAALFSKSSFQRNILYLVIIASSVQFVTAEIMVRFQKSALIILILIANAFIIFQFLRYGSSLFEELQSDRNEPSSRRSGAAKRAGCISEIVFRSSIVAIVAVLGTYLLVGREAFTEFGLITIGAVLLPIFILIIVQQSRLHRSI
jgi:hypothetical protein